MVLYKESVKRKETKEKQTLKHMINATKSVIHKEPQKKSSFNLALLEYKHLDD
jgi:hypothetical protein